MYSIYNEIKLILNLVWSKNSSSITKFMFVLEKKATLRTLRSE